MRAMQTSILKSPKVPVDRRISHSPQLVKLLGRGSNQALPLLNCTRLTIFHPAMAIGGKTPTVAHSFTSSEAVVRLMLEYDKARNGMENFTSKKPPTAAKISK